MAASESVSGPHPKVDARREYIPRPAARRTDEAPHAISAVRLRSIYFGLAAVWGFVVGVAGLLAALSFSGSPMTPDAATLAGLLPALGIAILGGWVLARAYYEAKQRRRR